jgi:hypothetical protein
MTRLLTTLVPRAWIRPARARTAVMILAVVTVLAACEGSSGQSGGARVFLSVNGFSVNGAGAPVSSVQSSPSQTTTTMACVTLSNNAKNPTITGSGALDTVFIESYTLTVDGRTFTFGTAVTVPPGTLAPVTNVLTGNTATFPVIVVPAGAKGAARTLSTAEFRFRGRDGRGQSVEARGAVTVLFDGDAEPTLNCGSGTPPPPPATTP